MDEIETTITEGDTLHDTVENRVLDIVEVRERQDDSPKKMGEVVAEPRDGGDRITIPEFGFDALRNARYSVLEDE